MIRPIDDSNRRDNGVCFYNKLNTCSTVKQAFRLFCSYVSSLFAFEKISLYVFDSENPFIKSSFEMTSSGRVHKDVRSYVSPQDIDMIWESTAMRCIPASSLHIPSAKRSQIDYIVPLVAVGETRGFLVFVCDDRSRSQFYAGLKDTLLQMAGYLAGFLVAMDKSRQIEEKNTVLAETREYVSSILENMVHGVISINNDGDVTTFSRGAEILLELAGDEVLGHNYRTVFPAQISDLIDEIKEHLRTQQYIVESETEYIMQGKFFIPIKFSASLLKDKQGNEAGLILICKDSSTVKRIIALQELRNMKSEFLSTASHEFKTPLNLIMGSAGILANGMVGQMNDQQRHLIGLIEEGGKRLHSLINDLLDISKIEYTEINGVQEVDLNKTLRDCMSVHEQSARHKSIDITTNISHHDLSIVAASQKIEKIFNNLLSNAVKYTPEGGRITVSMHRIESDSVPDSFYRFDGDNRLKITDNAVQIVVEDTGIGIDPADFELIFEEFKRVDSPSVRAVEGTGLGLAITRRIVDSLGGSIRVESEPGRGTRFIVQLPLVPLASVAYK